MQQKWISFLTGAAIALSSCGALCLSAGAAEVLDQQNDVGMSGTSDTASPFGQEAGQTFTVGMAGTLSRIELQINTISNAGGSAILTVYDTMDAAPDDALGTATLSASAIPSGTFAYQSFDVSALEIPVTVGQVLAYGVRSSGESLYALRSTFNVSTYAGGEAKVRSLGPPPGMWQSFSPSHDLGFKTYVTVADAMPGDFNNDTRVDAADFTVWRDHFGAENEMALGGNGNGMNGVDEADYDLWKTHFDPGTSGAGSGSLVQAQVPEPSICLVLACWAAMGICHVRRPNRRLQIGPRRNSSLS